MSSPADTARLTSLPADRSVRGASSQSLLMIGMAGFGTLVVFLVLRDIATLSGTALVLRLAASLVTLVAAGTALVLAGDGRISLLTTVLGIGVELSAIGLVATGVDVAAPAESYLYFSIAAVLVGLMARSRLEAAALGTALTAALMGVMLPALGRHWYLLGLVPGGLVLGGTAGFRLRRALQWAQLTENKLKSVAAESLAIAQENAKTALVDQLTGLPNRRAFVTELNRRLKQRGDLQLIVGLLDIDSFRSLNDRFGRAMGDHLLIEVGRRFLALDLVPMMLARVGSDEYAVLVQRNLSDHALSHFARALALALAQPFKQNATPTGGLTAAMGFARARAGDTSDTLLDRADFAAFEARRKGPGEVVLFSDELETRMARERVLENELLSADLEAQIRQVYQPIFDTETNTVIGYEVLARWQSFALGDVSPADFVPVAERLGLVPRITGIVTAAALAFSADLPEGQRVSVNLSPRDLNSADGMRRLLALIETTPYRPLRIDFEVTETAVMGDPEEAIRMLKKLRELGARISLDDFGTGQSSLSRVQTLPLDRIKIDRSFVVDVETNPASLSIVQTVVALCRNLDVTCLVEGVETEGQVKLLRDLGVRYFQGYLFGQPRPGRDIRAEWAAAASGSEPEGTAARSPQVAQSA